MLTKAQIMKRFDCEDFDAEQILGIQARGKLHGWTGQTFVDDEDFEVTIGCDIEQVENLMFADEGAVLAVYKAAVREGKKARRLADAEKAA